MPNTQEASPIQQFIELESIENGVIHLKNGGLRKILLVSGINFDLKSEEEQGMITYAFQSFLNTLDFSLQFFIHSRKLNIDDYLVKLEDREKQEPSELLKNQISEYREFIRAFVSQNAIMAKTFFVIVPYNPLRIPKAGTAFTEKLTRLFSKSTPSEQPQTSEQEQMEQLNLRIDQAIAGLNQIGLRAVPLDDDELSELFYNLYNPASVEQKKIDTSE
ncbi:MAG TPA: hypothetical protein VJH70_03015 [Candidatus Paceibacterota bacterium]